MVQCRLFLLCIPSTTLSFPMNPWIVESGAWGNFSIQVGFQYCIVCRIQNTKGILMAKEKTLNLSFSLASNINFSQPLSKVHKTHIIKHKQTRKSKYIFIRNAPRPPHFKGCYLLFCLTLSWLSPGALLQ